MLPHAMRRLIAEFDPGYVFATFNPNDTYEDFDLTNNNLTVERVRGTSIYYVMSRATLPLMPTRKYYWEIKIDHTPEFGDKMFLGVYPWSSAIESPSTKEPIDSGQGGCGWIWGTSGVWRNGTLKAGYTSADMVADEIISFAFDPIVGKIWIARNGVWMGSGDPAAGTNEVFDAINYKAVAPVVGCYGYQKATINFGRYGFAYTPPTGFETLQMNTDENYVTWSPTDKSPNNIVCGENLFAWNYVNSVHHGVRATSGFTTGKHYFEMYPFWCQEAARPLHIGLATDSFTGMTDTGVRLGDDAYSAAYFHTGTKNHNDVETAFGGAYNNLDSIGCAFDADTNEVWWSLNGVWQASGDPANGTNPAFNTLPADILKPAATLGGYAALWPDGVLLNCGQFDFRGTVPTGFTPGLYT
ncbi:SPRY domain-containing protein [Thermodesulfobacteriota bacterium]